MLHPSAVSLPTPPAGRPSDPGPNPSHIETPCGRPAADRRLPATLPPAVRRASRSPSPGSPTLSEVCRVFRTTLSRRFPRIVSQIRPSRRRTPSLPGRNRFGNRFKSNTWPATGGTDPSGEAHGEPFGDPRCTDDVIDDSVTRICTACSVTT